MVWPGDVLGITLAVLLGAAIGLEREIRGKSAADFRTKCASFPKKSAKSVQKLAEVCKSWYVLSKSWQKYTLFGPLFSTPLRKLYYVDKSNPVSTGYTNFRE